MPDWPGDLRTEQQVGMTSKVQPMTESEYRCVGGELESVCISVFISV